MSKPIRILVVGCGHMGTSHAKAYHALPEFEIVGVVSRGESSRRQLLTAVGAEYPQYADYEEALVATKPDAVSINTYPDTHAAYAKRAFAAGCHVFLEKPVAVTVAEAEEVVAAAKLANADEFIERMPHGYDTEVGERGSTLSGGQRQRLGIARAIVRNSPILILDEPTAALDTESERLVMEALQRLMKGRTAITIAHRLSTIRDSDQIIVLKDGVVAESGTHAELLARKGVYADLYQIQFGTGVAGASGATTPATA